jgi:hypothetical protein
VREYARAREIRDPPGQVKIAADKPRQTRRRAVRRGQNGWFSTEIVPVGPAEVAERAAKRAFLQLSTQNRHKNQAFSKMRMANTSENRICHGRLSRYRRPNKEGLQWPRRLDPPGARLGIHPDERTRDRCVAPLQSLGHDGQRNDTPARNCMFRVHPGFPPLTAYHQGRD